MVDIATLGIGLAALAVGLPSLWLTIRHTKMLRHTSELVDTMYQKETETSDLKRQELLQRKQEQEYRQFRDFAKALGWLIDHVPDEDEEEDY